MGVEKLNDYPLSFVADCLEHSIKKEQELPKFIINCLKELLHQNDSDFSSFENKNMRKAEDILKDYGLL